MPLSNTIPDPDHSAVEDVDGRVLDANARAEAARHVRRPLHQLEERAAFGEALRQQKDRAVERGQEQQVPTPGQTRQETQSDEEHGPRWRNLRSTRLRVSGRPQGVGHRH
jgi:hypothetical protein